VLRHSSADLLCRVDGRNGTLGAVFGVLTGLAVGLGVGGPAGAVMGALVGAFAGGYTATATAITEAGTRWLYHRLVCLGDRQCAVGTVKLPLEIAGLGEFDNDEYFDLALMPYPPAPAFEVEGDGNDPACSTAAKEALAKFPKKRVFTDGVQGHELVHPPGRSLGRARIPEGGRRADTQIAELRRNWLHCEAEGDFWVLDLAAAMGVLGGLTAAAAVGGGIGGAAAGCAIAVWLFGVGCIIGAIIGAAIAGGASAAIAAAILESIFETNPGAVEDANVADKDLGPIGPGDRVVVFGEHVYDGFHEGWHEIHPLLTICKIGTFKLKQESEECFYLQWDPAFPDGTEPFNEDLPGLALPKLTAEDMRQGLASDLSAARAKALRDRWCGLLTERFDLAVGEAQQGSGSVGRSTPRWTAARKEKLRSLPSTEEPEALPSVERRDRGRPHRQPPGLPLPEPSELERPAPGSLARREARIVAGADRVEPDHVVEALGTARPRWSRRRRATCSRRSIACVPRAYATHRRVWWTYGWRRPDRASPQHAEPAGIAG
jgi:hypothetical protein